VLSLCFLDHPVDFGALDGQGVDTVFTLMTPTVRSHLHLLSRLGFALHLPELRKIVNRSSTAQQITAAFAACEARLNDAGRK
jgi:PTS system nitrogen regulatory IIA component